MNTTYINDSAELIDEDLADDEEEDDPRVVTNPDGSVSFAPGVKLIGMGF